MSHFVLDGKASSDFGVGISGTGSWTTPTREIETAKIPGRFGSLLTYVGAWQNVEVTYPAFMSRRFDLKFDAFAEWWNAHTDNYYELSDTYHPGYYRMARPISELNPHVGTINRSGSFDLKFSCKPQKFLRDGKNARNIPHTGQVTLHNPTMYDAYPLIVCKMQNFDSILEIHDDYDTTIAQLTFAVEDDRYDYVNTDITYDAEIHEATAQFYENIVSANAAVSEEFPNDWNVVCIPAGKTVTFDSWRGEFDIYPRWYTI